MKIARWWWKSGTSSETSAFLVRCVTVVFVIRSPRGGPKRGKNVPNFSEQITQTSAAKKALVSVVFCLVWNIFPVHSSGTVQKSLLDYVSVIHQDAKSTLGKSPSSKVGQTQLRHCPRGSVSKTYHELLWQWVGKVPWFKKGMAHGLN